MKGNQAGRRGEAAADGNWKVLIVGIVDEFCFDNFCSRLYLKLQCVDFSCCFLCV